MEDQDRTALGYWPTFVIAFLGLAAVLVVEGYAWGTQWGVKAIGLGLTIIGGVGYFVWRGILTKSDLLRTGIEWVYGFCLLALFGGWILSPDPRQGLARIAWLLAYFLLFYILMDGFQAGANRRAALAALLSVSGLSLLFTLFETYGMYADWWQMVGSRKLMPPHSYRFVSLVGDANALAGFVNLAAPVAVVAFVKVRRKVERILLIFWLVLYAISLPFSFSRGGLVGMAAWIAILFINWLLHKDLLVWWRAQTKKRKLVWGFGGLVILGLYVLFFVKLIKGFANHPSHGNNLFGSSGEVWDGAVKVWLTSPWFGAGPGRYSFVFLEVTNESLSHFFPFHAHSVPLQVLAEFGIVGGLAFLAMAFWSIRWFWQRHKLIGKRNKTLAAAVLAGGAGWAAHMLVDELTGFPIVMVSLILLLALLVNLADEPLDRWNQISNNLLILPCLMLAIGAGWGLWAYAPQASAVQELNLEPCSAAPLFTLSMERDPNYAYYATSAGFAWAACGTRYGNEDAYNQAHQAFGKSLEIEPHVSLILANQAVVDWQSDRFNEKAIPNMQHAIALSPNEPSYYLNLGWFYEESGQIQAAVSAYSRALELRPSWADHPFWQLTEVRQTVFTDWQKSNALPENDADMYWFKARQAIEAEDYPSADVLLAKAEWVDEAPLAIQVSRGLLAEAQGERPAAIEAYQQAASLVQQRALQKPHRFMLYYTTWMNRRQGISADYVQGYLQLDQDFGQFTALEKLYATYCDMGKREKAGEIWKIWHQAMHGGALEPIQPEPGCN